MPKLNTSSILSLSLFLMILLQGCSKSGSTDAVVPVTPSNSVTVVSVSPLKGLANSAITINGTNFDTDLTKTTVTVGGITAQIYTVTATQIVAGVPTSGTGGKIIVTSDGVSATSASDFTITTGSQTTFINAYYETIAISPSGDVFTEDQLAVYKTSVTNTAAPAVFSGNPNSVNGPFRQMGGIALDAAGNIYATDQYLRQVFKITPTGTYSVFAGSGAPQYADGQGTAAGIVQPYAVITDVAGNIYVGDAGCIRKITPSGLVSTFVGTYNALGNVDGKGAGAKFGYIASFAIDNQSNIYAVDGKYFTVRKITPDGTVTTIAGNGLSAFTNGLGKNAQFYAPEGIALDAAGNLFVSDSYYGSSYQIRMINTAGYVSTFIKGTYPRGVVNGDLSAASPDYPNGLAFDAAGNLYICNTGFGTGSAKVSKITFK